ncbi:MAG: hypothetical protein GXP47_03270 [Acidobacteria bacterium]|nr:hypothetical protein [Acidobacteriota bacterium]
MTVERYRSVEEMPAPATPRGTKLYRRIAEVWHTARVLARRQYPHAVLKFRNIEEAQAARKRWERENRPSRKP